MVDPADFKELWQVEHDREQDQSNFVVVNVLLRHVGVRPVLELTQVADSHVSLQTEDDRAVDRGHEGSVDQRNQEWGYPRKYLVAVGLTNRREAVDETAWTKYCKTFFTATESSSFVGKFRCRIKAI